MTISFAGGVEAVGLSPADFFTPAHRSSAGLDSAGIYPQGKQFGFGLYSILGTSKVDSSTSNMHRAAAQGFTLAGPYYDNSWRNLSNVYSAANEGMKFTFQIRPPAPLYNVSVDGRPAALDKLTNAQMAASVREQVTAVLNDPIADKTVARWSLGLDELRYWHKSEMRYLKIASETIRAVENERGVPHRPFWMYEPRHRNAAALETTGVYQDMTIKGVYLTSVPRGPERSAYAMWGYSQILAAANRLNTVPQAALQLSEDFTDPRTGSNPAEIRRVLRHDAYLGLVMGMKGFNVWSMYEERPNLTTHNEQFQAYASVAKDLTGELDLQDVFLFGEKRSDLDVVVTSGPKEFRYTDFYGDKFTNDTLHFLNAAVGTDRYLFLVNSTEQAMDVRIDGLPSSFVMEDLFAGTATDMQGSSMAWRLDVLGVAALRFRQLTEPVPPSSSIEEALPSPIESVGVAGTLVIKRVALLPAAADISREHADPEAIEPVPSAANPSVEQRVPEPSAFVLFAIALAGYFTAVAPRANLTPIRTVRVDLLAGPSQFPGAGLE